MKKAETPDAFPPDDTPEVEWSYEAEKLYEQGYINAATARLMSGHVALSSEVSGPDGGEKTTSSAPPEFGPTPSSRQPRQPLKKDGTPDRRYLSSREQRVADKISPDYFPYKRD